MDTDADLPLLRGFLRARSRTARKPVGSGLTVGSFKGSCSAPGAAVVCGSSDVSQKRVFAMKSDSDTEPEVEAVVFREFRRVTDDEDRLPNPRLARLV